MRAPKAPRGYYRGDWPLPVLRELEFGFSLYGGESPAENCTIIPLFYHDEKAQLAPQDFETNPINAGFTEVTDAGAITNSIIPYLKLNITASLTKFAVETDKVRYASFMVQPIYTAFKQDLDATDQKTTETVASMLELQYDASTEEVFPIFHGTDLPENDGGNFGPSQLGLTTDVKPEGVTFDFDNLAYMQRHSSVKGIVNKILGKRKWYTITRDRPVRINSSNYVFPTVKRANTYMFCGLIIYAPDEYNKHSLITSGDLSDPVAGSHIKFMMNWSFDIWNPLFDSSEEQ